MISHKVVIIAEAGVNHNGNIDYALRLIDAAAESGADFIKFQTFKAEKLVSSIADKANYQMDNTLAGETQLQMLKKLELSACQHEQLIAHCKLKNIRFFSTAFDLDSLKYLSQIGLEMVKIPSGEITNLPYLKLAAQLFDKVILSTGMATMQEVKNALQILVNAGISKENITILHCNTDYPTPMKDVNLKAMLHIRDDLGTAIGYSDHTLGIEVPIAAVSLGAVIIEKHFTLNKKMEGPDHKASLDPQELKAMVLAIRNVELALSGSGEKLPSPSEAVNISIARKSIHLTMDVCEGTLICEHHLTMMRPGDGISPMELDNVIGRRTSRTLKSEAKLKWEDLL